MKTLYDILGLGSAATPEQVEHAFVTLRTRLESGESGFSPSELHNQTVAVKAAYATLIDPVARQRYDQKLAMAREGSLPVSRQVEAAETSEGLFGTKTLLIVGLFVLAGIYMYNEKAKERERLRIEHEHEVQMKAAQIEEDRLRQSAQLQSAIVETVSTNAAAQQRLAEQRQFEAESSRRQRMELQRQQMEIQQQRQDQMLQQREEANRQRQEQFQAQQRAQAEKRYLQQLEREHYGKVITH
jgi:hypothetical protein